MTVAGELDEGSAEPLIRAVTSLLGGAAPAVVEIEASRLNFLDSSGIRALLICRGLVGNAGGRLVLTNPRPAVTEVLEITHLCELFGLPVPAGAPRPPENPVVSESAADLFIRSAAARSASREIRDQARALRLTGDLRRQP
ncbi:hypothetical protein Asp14428_20980 [Actinoplanes sp. NBRC 14428]|nr:hypothetical protein Asp14428_20980 [Actinoplanes sp. NBRC 14428]